MFQGSSEEIDPQQSLLFDLALLQGPTTHLFTWVVSDEERRSREKRQACWRSCGQHSAAQDGSLDWLAKTILESGKLYWTWRLRRDLSGWANKFMASLSRYMCFLTLSWMVVVWWKSETPVSCVKRQHKNIVIFSREGEIQYRYNTNNC